VKHPAPERNIGLARAISKLGYCSRSQAALLIRGRHVRLNGALRLNPETPVHLETDRIEIDGKAIEASKKIYLMLNKPRGVVTTASDEQGREDVYAYLDERLPWIAPVGRLDRASEGLLLLTNDSEWAARVLAPENHVDKTYHVQVRGVLSESHLQRIENGLVSSDGEPLRVKKAQILRQAERNTWLEIILDEGKNRQIRRILEHFAIEVLRLIRVSIGPLSLGQLAKGMARALTSAEKSAMDSAIGLR
jgi:23S rRNA pseudouridine2605 synthase